MTVLLFVVFVVSALPNRAHLSIFSDEIRRKGERSCWRGWEVRESARQVHIEFCITSLDVERNSHVDIYSFVSFKAVTS